jgi:hypothetical protein
MPQEILHDLWIVPILPQQCRVGVTKSVPTLQRDTQLNGNWFYTVLHYPAHPIRLFTLLFEGVSALHSSSSSSKSSSSGIGFFDVLKKALAVEEGRRRTSALTPSQAGYKISR